jgi:curli biogenesis system outer membrane secretion channel CsgG
MQRSGVIAILIGLCVVGVAAAAAASRGKPSLAVLSLRFRDPDRSMISGRAPARPSTQYAADVAKTNAEAAKIEMETRVLGKDLEPGDVTRPSWDLAEKVAAALVRTDQFRVVERSRFAELVRDGLAPGTELRPLAARIGADYLLFGTLDAIVDSTREERPPYKAAYVVRERSLSGDVRLVDGVSAEVVAVWNVRVTGSADAGVPALETMFAERVADEARAWLAPGEPPAPPPPPPRARSPKPRW